MHEAAHDAEDEISDVVGQLRVEQNLPQGFVEDATDCDDTNLSINPLQTDLPDLQFVDSNCDGSGTDIKCCTWVLTIADIEIVITIVTG